jgi:hypothetical protein
VISALRKFVSVRPGDSVDDGCIVENVNQHTTTYSKIHGGLPTHQILPNEDIIFRFESTKDSGEYQCQAITDKGTFSASFYGIQVLSNLFVFLVTFRRF